MDYRSIDEQSEVILDPLLHTPAQEEPGDLSSVFVDEDGLSDLPPLSSYALFDDAHRRAFLHHFYLVGETALFAAVAHVWVSLAEPREERCTLIGLTSGTGGKGKKGLVLTLQKFLAEALAVNNHIPERSGYDSLDRWHEAAMAAFAADERDVGDLCARYSAILEGTKVERQPTGAKILSGPWLAP